MYIYIYVYIYNIYIYIFIYVYIFIYIYTTILELGPQNHSKDGLFRPSNLLQSVVFCGGF